MAIGEEKQQDGRGKETGGSASLRINSVLRKRLFLAVLILVGLVRLTYCWLKPVNTSDAERNLWYGVAVVKDGIRAANLTPPEISSSRQRVGWPDRPFVYPALALYFFAGVGAVCANLFFLKVLLTLLEAINAWLVAKIAGDRVLGLIYWISPLSIWWVSGEGQFEPVQNVFVLASLALIATRWWAAAFVALALAIQVKVSAVFMIPWVVYVAMAKRSDPATARRARYWVRGAIAFGALIVGFLPSLPASGYHLWPHECLQRATGGLFFNAMYWNFRHPLFKFSESLSPVGAWWLWISTTALLVGLIGAGVRKKRLIENALSVAGPFAYLAVLRVLPYAQSWYLLPLASFIIPIRGKSLPRVLLALVGLSDPFALGQMVFGPFGYFRMMAEPVPFSVLHVLRLD